MKTNTIFVAAAVTAVVAFGFFASNLAFAEQSATSPFAVLSASPGPSSVMQLVRGGHGGGGFHGGFHGGRAFHGGHFGHFHGRHFYGGGFYGAPYYYYSEPYCENWVWDSDLDEWVCSDVD